MSRKRTRQQISKDKNELNQNEVDEDDDLNDHHKSTKKRKISQPSIRKKAVQQIANDTITCNSCNHKFKFQEVDLSPDKIKFIDKWFCSKCQDKVNKITYKCDVLSCKSNDKSWRLFSTLRKHYIDNSKKEDHQNSAFLTAFSYKMCEGDDCDELMDENSTNLCTKCIKNKEFQQFVNLGNPLQHTLSDESSDEEKQIIDDEPTFYEIFTSPMDEDNTI